MTAKPDISVVICTYSIARWDELLAAVESVRSQTVPPLEIVVVVDHDSSLFELLSSAAPDVVAVENDGPRGLSSARNAGIAASHGDVVAFLDDDALADPAWLERLAAGYRDPHVGAVGGAVEPMWLLGRPQWFPHEFDWVVGCSYPGLPAVPASTRNLIGANMSFRRDVLESVGGFHSDLGRLGPTPLGCEETELCIRASNANGTIVLYDPTARVRHRVPASRARWSYFFRRCWAEGLSKAHVSALVGAGGGLASERSYTRTILPRGVARGVGDAVRGNSSGIGRAFAIVAGLVVTAAGFVAGYPRARPWTALVPYLGAVAGALGLWAVALARIDVRAMSDLGLVSVLPRAYFAAIALLTVSFCLALRNARVPQPVLALHAAAYILVIHATPSILYGTLRYAWAWKHVGIVDYIERHGSVDPNISFLAAYHNWPGFFALAAMFTKAAGLHSPLTVAQWAPPFFNLLFLAPLVVIFRALTNDYRRVWLAVWIFFSANWVGQDYFSPQAFSYFLYLALLAICLVWFRPSSSSDGGPPKRLYSRLVRFGDTDAPPAAASTPGQRAGLVGIIVVICAVVVASHQLTPFMAICALGALVVFQRCVLRGLPLLIAVFTASWITFLAVGFLKGNLYWIVESIGNPGGNANSTLINLGQASHGQRTVALIDRMLTASVWSLALLGFARRFWRGRIDLTAALLAAAPFLMLWGNAYGGEMLFRVYFFSLPFVAFLAAGLFFSAAHTGRVPLRKTGVALAGSLALFTGLLFGYYGKERQNYFSKDEVRAAQYLYGVAPQGSLLIGGVNDYPWAFKHYERYTYVALADSDARSRRRTISDPVAAIERMTASDRAHAAYVVITRSQKAAVDETGVLPAGSLDRIERKLARSPAFRTVFANRDASVFLHTRGRA
jgi:GT2 family glycosyltransferase